MAIELNTYETTCPECGKVIELTANDLAGFFDDIENEIADARKDERADVEREFNGMVDPDDLPIDAREVQELASAIQHGDTVEAMLLLRRIFDPLPSKYANAIDIGQFMKVAK